MNIILKMVLIYPLLARAQIDTVYVVPLSHTDIGFTAAPSDVARQSVVWANNAAGWSE